MTPAEQFITHLLTPSRIMSWLIILLPVLITISALSGWFERERGNRRLTFWGGLMVIWLFLPITFPMVEMRQLSAMISVFGWFGLLAAWGHHVWTYRPTPIWAHALVITHLVALFVGVIVAFVRAATSL